MRRSDLIESLHLRTHAVPKQHVDQAVRLIIDALIEALSRGDRVEIRGFGSFSLNYRPARIARNPKSGEQVLVEAKYTPHFKAGKELRARVDGATVQEGTDQGAQQDCRDC